MPWNGERFKKCLKAHAGDEKVFKLMESCGAEPKSASPTKKAAYVKCLMDNFDKQFPQDVRTKVMEECGRKCISASTVEKAKKIGQNSKTLEELVGELNKSHIGGGHLRLEGNQIHASYDRCYCGSVKQTKERFSPTYCNCSRGWYLELFEQAMGKPVKVDMLESVVQGAKTCKFIIHV
jgi:predicted hydrocarbon binding protein